MDTDHNDSDLQTSQENDDGQSLVGKFKKNMTEIISNTPLSKWFRKQNDASTSSVRRRQDDSEDEEDLQEFQPPTKRTKLPPTKETLSLNVSDVLSPISSVNNVKKPLYRNFPEPIAGPSGYQTRKMLNSTSFVSESRSVKIGDGTETMFKNPKTTLGSSELANKDNNSDSEGSTSGYSSGRIGSKEIISQESSKQSSPLENSPQKNRSLFQGSSLFVHDRSLSPNRNSSLSSRMPSFNPSTFGTSSFIDRTLSTKRILSSPFYSGHTIYGGASAYSRRAKRTPHDIQKLMRNSVRIKPANRGVEKGNLQLGKTARRILDTLEQYSSPISDAKKIPVVSKKYKSDGSLTRYIGANPYTLRESRSASNIELQVPSVSDLLKVKLDQQKTRLQDSTEAVRQIATKSNSPLNNESYRIPVHSQNEKHTTKIKTKITSVRHKIQIEEVVPEVHLTPVSLPIKELPKFDITIPPPVQKPVATTASGVSISITEPISATALSGNSQQNSIVEPKVPALSPKQKSKLISQDESEFKFSAPLVLAEYLKPLKALNNFKFSEPLVKKRRSIHPELDELENKVIDANKTKKNNGENISSWFKTPGTKIDSVMDKFKPKENTWECSVCLIRNQSDKVKCAACESLKPKSTSLSESVKTFGPAITFKPSEQTWECPTCMIRNKEELQKCAACEEKKPEKSASNGVSKVPYAGMEQNVPSKSTDQPSNFVSSKTAETSFKSDTKFTYPSNTWECSSCLIRNKDEVTKCACCESPKPQPKVPANQSAPAAFIADFKKKDGEWECEACMVRNKADADKCQCCENSNPKIKSSSASSSAASSKRSSFNFGIDKNTASSFTFGIPPDSHLSQNSPKTNASLVFGEKRQELSAKPLGSQNFTFGMPPKISSDEASKDLPKPSEKADPSPAFSCAVASKPGDVDDSKSSPKINFGVDTKTPEATPNKPALSCGSEPKTATSTPRKNTLTNSLGSVSKPSESTSNKTPTFSFGSTGGTEGTRITSVAPTFSFGIIKKSGTPPAPTFSFGITAKSEGAALGTAAPTFTFCSENKTDNKDSGNINPSGETRINPLLKPNEKLPEKATVAPVRINFGLSKASSQTPVSSTTVISRTRESSPNKRTRPAESESIPQAKIPMFSFGTANTNGNVSSSTFSKPVEESKTATPSAGGFSFSFGSGKTAATTTNSATVAPTFGSSVTQADISKQVAPMFKFASSPEPPKPANSFSFGTSVPAFGSKPPVNTTEAKPFTFGSPGQFSQPQSSSFAAAPPKTGMFSFVGSSENKQGSFAFNTLTAENKATSQFSPFGSSPPKTQPSFGFNQSPASTFSFGSTQKSESGFGVGSTTTVNPFGAANSKPDSVFGAAPTQTSGFNGTFNFGAPTTTNQKAGFSFGASSTSSEGGAAQSGFNFGSSPMNPSAPAASGGFNFSETAPSFDANTKPSFNFTGGAGITAFSAPPARDGSMPPRKIKKAVRRTVR